jgi:hypothetical protein
MTKNFFWTIGVLSLIAVIAINMSLAKPNVIFNTLFISQIEAMSDETYDGGELDPVIIICNAGLYGRCHEIDITSNGFYSYKACCVTNGNMSSYCYSWQEVNCCRCP